MLGGICPPSVVICPEKKEAFEKVPLSPDDIAENLQLQLKSGVGSFDFFSLVWMRVVMSATWHSYSCIVTRNNAGFQDYGGAGSSEINERNNHGK